MFSRFRLALLVVVALAAANIGVAQDRSKTEKLLRGNQPGELRRDNGFALSLVWIPPGNFKMGSPKEQVTEREPPQVKVTLARGFWLGTTEVTQAQWKAVMRTEPWQQGRGREGDDYPAMFVGWKSSVEAWQKAGVLPTTCIVRQTQPGGLSVHSRAPDLE